MDHIGCPAARPAGEITLFKKSDPQTPQGSVPRDPRPNDPPSNDDQIVAILF